MASTSRAHPADLLYNSFMLLNAFVAEKRRRIFEDLADIRPPSEGTYDEAVLAMARAKGLPQHGATRYRPDALILEFIYPAESGPSTVFTVTLPVPERVVFLPVPTWVVENIWQGEIDGTYHFESEARDLLSEFEKELLPNRNVAWFGPRQATRRE